MNPTEPTNAPDSTEPPWQPPARAPIGSKPNSALWQVAFAAVSCLIPVLLFVPQIWPILVAVGAGFVATFVAVMASNRRRTGRGALLFLLLLLVPIVAILVVLAVGILSME